MSLPTGWTTLGFDAVRGLPQAASVPAGPRAQDLKVQGLRALLVAAPGDLARLLSAPAQGLVHRGGEQSAPVAPGPARPPEPVHEAAHRAAHRTAVDDLTRPAPDSISDWAVPVHVVVAAGREVLVAWPAVTGRALPVAGASGLLGHLWVDTIRLAAGSLVRPGRYGSDVVVGWWPGGLLEPPLPGATSRSPEDPHDLLV